jgi:deoxyxylulose-5-phosphate synthase
MLYTRFPDEAAWVFSLMTGQARCGDGETPNGVFDVGYFTQIPYMTVTAPQATKSFVIC